MLTSAGNAAGIDLCLHVVRRDHGPEVANRVARRSVVRAVARRRAVAVHGAAPRPAGPGTASTRAWAVDHLDQPITLADLAGTPR